MTPHLDNLPATERMPVLFLGHGSPMNAIEESPFSRSLVALGTTLPKPSAVLVVSAHWLTSHTTRVLSAPCPRTIHDFWGFPPELYEVHYPAPGSREVAEAAAEATGAEPDDTWGLDHASWAVLRRLWPRADVPVLELSLDVTAPPEAHVGLARRLAPLRERGVLIVGSGNVVHNLGAVKWDRDEQPYDWAVEFDEWVRERVLDRDVETLSEYERLGRTARLAAPTNDHYLPLLYTMAMARDDEPVAFTYEGIEMGSVSMRCVRVG